MSAIGSERTFVIAAGVMLIAAVIVAGHFHVVSPRQAVRLGGLTVIVVLVLCWLVEPPRNGESG